MRLDVVNVDRPCHAHHHPGPHGFEEHESGEGERDERLDDVDQYDAPGAQHLQRVQPQVVAHHYTRKARSRVRARTRRVEIFVKNISLVLIYT